MKTYKNNIIILNILNLSLYKTTFWLQNSPDKLLKNTTTVNNLEKDISNIF